MLSKELAVTDSAALVHNADRHAAERLQIHNAGAQQVFLGGPDVASTTGYPLAAGASLQLQVYGQLHACCAAGQSSSLRVLTAS